MRYPLIDCIRGISVIGMMFFHANYMLEHIFFADMIPLPDIFWDILGPMVAYTFILVSGFSFFFASKDRPIKEVWKKSLPRTMKLVFIAILISYVTYTFIPEQRISWGIIHFFALSSMVIFVFYRIPKYSFIFGFFFILLGYIFARIAVDGALLIPLGLSPVGYFSADYYPLFPWFGYMLIGYSLAYWISQFGYMHAVSFWDKYLPQGVLFIGRHALVFYALHVPILYGVLVLLYQ